MDAPGRKVISKNSVDWLHFPMNPRLVAALLILLITAVYLPSISNPFVFDDIPELVQNPDVLSFSGCLDTISRSPNTGLSGRPVACMTFAANVMVGQFSVHGFHVVNIIIHVLAALTLFGVVRHTMARSHPSVSDLPTMTSGVIAALWALHPLQTESVTYVIQRIESLAGLWYLLTLYCAIRSWDSGRPVPWSILSMVSCSLGMLTKEIVVTAPLIVLLYDRVFIHRAMSCISRRKTRLHLVLAATWIIPILLMSRSPRGGSAGFGLGVSALDYLRTQAGVIVHYLRLSFWPFPQAISYSDWPIVREWPPSLVPGFMVLVLLLISIAGLIKRQWWGFCGAWFFLILAPSSSFLPIVTEPAAERRMYLPLAGVIIVIAFGLLRFSRAILCSPRTRQTMHLGLSIAAILAFTTATIFRNAQYATAVKILTSTLTARPGDELVRGALVEELVRVQRMDEAGKIQQEGIARNPNSHILYDNWARTMSDIGRHEEAIRAFSKAIGFRPDHYPSQAGLGVALMATGRFADALPHLQQAARLAPHAFTIRGNLAVALANLGRTEEAITELQIATTLKPSFADGHYNLARLLAGQGKSNEAVEHFRIAAALRPNDTELQSAFAQALQNAGRADEASSP